MASVFYAALGIGGSTLLGTACGFLVGHVTDLWNDVVTAFAAGVMLAAASFGLFVPAMEMGSVYLVALGAACGVAFLRLISKISARLGRSALWRNPRLMFVLAIALHKFPEGMAGGVALSGMNRAAARTMVLGIALQNLPEGAVMIPPLLGAGVGKMSAAGIALFTGLLNAAGVFAGALWGRAAGALLPFALAFAGGAMLDVIVSQMLPQVSGGGRERGISLLVLLGFTLMLCVNMLG